MSANWPIRVGGVYTTKYDKHIRSAVTDVCGNSIHYHTQFELSDGKWKDSRGGPSYASVEDFCAASLREDASLIPDLIAALKGVYAGCVNKADEETLTLNMRLDAWKAVEAALAKAGAL